MISVFPQLEWITQQQQVMLTKLRFWAEINTGSMNLNGLNLFREILKRDFAILNTPINEIELPEKHYINDEGIASKIPVGKALHFSKRPEATTRVFLCGHMDTVYHSTHSFQKTEIVDNRLKGPGVADMKGGLLILLSALEALEQHPAAKNIGWEVVLNPDEEIGSESSEKLIKECAKRCDLALVFEPSFSDGSLVSSRKGSVNGTFMVKGKAAHAGRDFEKGRNALTAIAKFALEAERLNDVESGTTINIGQFVGGGPVNIVPGFGLCRFNIRATNITHFDKVKEELLKLAAIANKKGFLATIDLPVGRIPKFFGPKDQQLFNAFKICAKDEGFELSSRPSGGVCDGNLISEMGIPVIDTLGAVGGNIHTPDEYILIDSLVERSRLVARFLIQLAMKN